MFLCGALVTMVSVVPLVSLVSVGILCGALVNMMVPVVPLVSLVSVGVFVWSHFSDHGTCSVSGVLGVCWSFCAVLW